ncbi:MAG: efflux RND transporter periplasmic adaptor subunit [Acidobacteria bacterium]|nr:efflux RND transporter periplasmic adaptor subunit [Acidobacteriota bacterium]
MNSAWSRWSAAVPYVVAVGITVALFVWPSDRTTADAPARRADTATPVTTVPVTRQPLRQTYDATGVAAGVVDVKIAAQTRGLLRDVPVRVGSGVRAGDVIATQHDELLRADLEQAEAALARSSDERRRVEQLAEKQLADRNRLQSVIAQHRFDTAAVAKARTLLDLSQHRSPISGVVTEQVRYSGDPVEEGSHIATVTDVSRLRVLAKVPEAVALRITPGDAAELQAGGLAGPRTARVARIYPSADAISHQVTVELDAGSVYPQLKPGYLVTVRFTTAHVADAVTVDRRVVPSTLAPGPAQVFVVKDSRAEARAIEIGVVLDDQVQVLRGLAAGDQVIATGQAGVRDGAAVRVVPASAVRPVAQ